MECFSKENWSKSELLGMVKSQVRLNEFKVIFFAEQFSRWDVFFSFSPLFLTELTQNGKKQEHSKNTQLIPCICIVES